MKQLQLRVKDIENIVNQTKESISLTNKEVEELRYEVATHISANDMRDEKLSDAITDIKKGLDAHMKEEMGYHRSREDFENKIFDSFDKVNELVHTVEDKVVSNGFKTKVMWSVMIAVGTALLALGFGVVQSITEDKVKEYSESPSRYESASVDSGKYSKVLEDNGVTLKEVQ